MPPNTSQFKQIEDMPEESINHISNIKTQVSQATTALSMAVARMRKLIALHPENTALNNASADLELSSDASWDCLERLREIRRCWGSFEDKQPTKEMAALPRG